MHIVCPWHGWEFHMKDGTHVIDSRHRLKKYDVVLRGDQVYVSV
jgi:nitrite reductase (NADH) small subunit